MNRPLRADSLRIITTSLVLAFSSFQIRADTDDNPGPAAATGTGQTAAVAQASSSQSATAANIVSDGGGNPAPVRHRRHSLPHGQYGSGTGNNPLSSWPSLSAGNTSNGAAAATEPAHDGDDAPIANSFSRASDPPHTTTVSRVSDWMPNGITPADASTGISTSGRLDLIAEKYGKAATVDFNSRIQEPNGVIAFRAIDNQTGERETIRINRSGDIELKSGWPD